MEPVHDDGFHQAELENYNQDSVLRSQRVASYVWLLTACVAFVAYVACVACVLDCHRDSVLVVLN